MAIASRTSLATATRLDRLPFLDRQGTYLAFVGRVTPEKGVAEAIDLARRTNVPLRIDRLEQEHFAEVAQPAIDEGIVTFLGELAPPERDALYAGAVATVMLGAWPEPFGLVPIQSMATGTPVIARRAGGPTETIEHHVTGFLVDDLTEAELAVRQVGELSRTVVRRHVIERFLPGRTVDASKAVRRRFVAPRAGTVAERRSTAAIRALPVSTLAAAGGTA